MKLTTLSRGRALSRSRVLARDFAGELHRMHDSHHREADTVACNRIILTPRNVMNEVFKLHREHLYPITSIPSFRHCLMWALQSKMYTMNWQFNFTTS